MKTKVTYIENLQLDGDTESGHKVKMDSTPAGETSFGPTPKELVLQGLAGCTMMDVASILQKQNKELKKFWIEVEAELANKHPKVFTKINVKYNFVSSDLDESTARNAIELSRDKYCAINNMLNKSVNITYTLEIKKI